MTKGCRSGSPSIVGPRWSSRPDSRFRRRGSRQRRESRSTKPPTAANDNETLDHLLSRRFRDAEDAGVRRFAQVLIEPSIPEGVTRRRRTPAGQAEITLQVLWQAFDVEGCPRRSDAFQTL